MHVSSSGVTFRERGLTVVFFVHSFTEVPLASFRLAFGKVEQMAPDHRQNLYPAVAHPGLANLRVERSKICRGRVNRLQGLAEDGHVVHEIDALHSAAG